MTTVSKVHIPKIVKNTALTVTLLGSAYLYTIGMVRGNKSDQDTFEQNSEQKIEIVDSQKNETKTFKEKTYDFATRNPGIFSIIALLSIVGLTGQNPLDTFKDSDNEDSENKINTQA